MAVKEEFLTQAVFLRDLIHKAMDVFDIFIKGIDIDALVVKQLGSFAFAMAPQLKKEY